MITLTSKVNTITEQYLERFGKARVAVYHLVIFQQEPFSSFLNALMITLRRKDLMPCYTWFSTTVPNTRYLFLWCNGYFKTNLSDITPIVGNLATLHWFKSFCEFDCLAGDMSSIRDINARLNNLITWYYSPKKQFHQRSFGTSAMW